jgi:hypothetical protein
MEFTSFAIRLKSAFLGLLLFKPPIDMDRLGITFHISELLTPVNCNLTIVYYHWKSLIGFLYNFTQYLCYNFSRGLL